MLYKIHVNDRNYTDWKFYTVHQFQEVALPNIRPAEQKLFSNDVFSIDKTAKNIVLEHSSVRVMQSIPGVLVLKTTKTYGRDVSGSGKLLYKVVPDDMRLPSFLVPYEIKTMGFSKVFVNLYVTFTFIEWNDKHPRGVLSQVIGSVDVLDNFYEYQLYCKSLNTSIQKFTKDASKSLKNASHDAFIENIMKKYPTIVDRRTSDISVITIDPPKSTDFDDGFSIQEMENDTVILSIYISNVTIWMDVLNLWESFSRRISTIYLPDRKRPMLPTVLSDYLCSLQENTTRFAFVMDVTMQKETAEILDISYSNCAIRVYKNYVYEESALHENKEYHKIMDMCKLMSKKYRYLQNVRNSHDLVCYLMIFMNYHCAVDLLQNKNGIFRSTTMKELVPTSTNDVIPDVLPEDIIKFIKIWNSGGGQYVDASVAGDNLPRHELLNMDAYIHITSPIRRLVDLLNIIQFQQNKSMILLSENSKKFYDKWTAPNELEYINTTMRSIRKVQNDCTLLEMYVNHPEKMEPIYEGYVFDRILRNDGLFQYVVHLPELKLTLRITLREFLDNFEKKNFKMYLFNDEENLKKKIRLQIYL